MEIVLVVAAVFILELLYDTQGHVTRVCNTQISVQQCCPFSVIILGVVTFVAPEN